MIELVFVIVVLGILASLAMGRMERDLKQEASEHILSHIRLTQQLALRDNKHLPDNNTTWQRAYWQINFDCTSDCKYTVGSDLNLNGSVEMLESAIDPTNGKYLLNDGTDTDMSEKVLLEKKFGIHSIVSSLGVANNYSIGFDYLGRPHHQVASYGEADFSKIMTNDCRLKFEMSTDDSFTIRVKSETGYAYIE